MTLSGSTHRTSEGSLRVHSRQDSQSRLWADGARNRRPFRHQLAQRRDVPSEGAGEKGADHPRAEHVAGHSAVGRADRRARACRWPGALPPACCTRRSSRTSGSISTPCSATKNLFVLEVTRRLDDRRPNRRRRLRGHSQTAHRPRRPDRRGSDRRRRSHAQALVSRANRIRLEPANSTMKPIYVKNAKILGVVVGVVRKVE